MKLKKISILVILLSIMWTGNLFAQQPVKVAQQPAKVTQQPAKVAMPSKIVQQPAKVKIKVDSLPTALLVIDVQDFYFPGGRLPLVNPEAASEKAATVIQLFRSQNLPVIHIQHAGGAPIHKNVTPLPGEKVITKKEANGFNGTDLLVYLNSLKVKRLIICGMQTQMCVEATTRAAYDLGFKCYVVEDACATRNLMYGRRTIFANDVQACALTIMDGYYAKVINAAGLE